MEKLYDNSQKITLQAIIPYILPDKELRRVGRGIIFKSEYRVIPIFWIYLPFQKHIIA